VSKIDINLSGLPNEPPTPAVKRRGNRITRVPEILEVSIAVFAAEGAAGFSQRRVASEAGIRLNTLQHYFRTRDELLRSTIEEMAKRYLGHYRTIAKDKDRSADARLEAIADEAFAAFSETGPGLSAFSLHCWSVAEHEVFVRKLMADLTGELVDLLTGLVALINPTLPSAESFSRGQIIASHLLGLIAFTRRVGHSKSDLDALKTSTKQVWRTISVAK